MTLTVLLDIDGTLVDSNDLHAASWHETLAAFDIHVPLEKVRGLIGKGSDKLLPELSGHTPDSPKGEALVAHRKSLFMREYIPRVRAFPEARAFVARLIEAGHRPVVATSAGSDELSALLARANLADLLSMTTTSDDANRSKPDPDIVHAALSLARAQPREAIFIGDTPYDLLAATRAGVRFIGVRSGGYDAHALRGALAVYRDVAELVEKFDESPLGSH